MSRPVVLPRLLALLATAVGGCGWFASDPPPEPRAPILEDAQERPHRGLPLEGHPRRQRVHEARVQARRQRPELEPVEPAPLQAGHDLLIVTWDTVRADHCSLYGYHRATTPVLDALSSEAVVFDRFLVPMSTTLPSHASLFTGLQPDEHGILANVTITGERFVPSERLVPLASHLRERGWLTAGFVSSAPVKWYTGIAAGFEVWEEPGRHDRDADKTNEEVLAWLQTLPADQPAFVWVHYVDPHWPYEPSEEDLARFEAEDPVLEALVKAQEFGRGPRAARAAQRKLDRYDAEILATDRATGALLEAWADTGRGDRSVVVIAGDHGEGLGQHQHLEHGLVWQEQIHTVLMATAPGAPARRIPYPVGMSDVLPTVLGLGDFPDEQALLDQASGVDVLAEDFAPRPVYARTSARQSRNKGEAATFSLTDGRWKLTVDAEGEVQLYDHETDPYELHDVAEAYPERVAAWREELRRRRAAFAVRAEAAGVGAMESIGEEALGELEALGYVE